MSKNDDFIISVTANSKRKIVYVVWWNETDRQVGIDVSEETPEALRNLVARTVRDNTERLFSDGLPAKTKKERIQ